MKYFTIKIPTKPYLAKYIKSRYGDPIPLSYRNSFGLLVLGLLEKKAHTHRSLNQVHLVFKSFTTFVTIQAPEKIIYKYGFDISDHNVIQINSFFDSLFEEHLLMTCMVHTDKTKRYAGYKKIIERFAADHNIILEEDISADGLKRMELRARKKYFPLMSLPETELFSSS